MPYAYDITRIAYQLLEEQKNKKMPKNDTGIALQTQPEHEAMEFYIGDYKQIIATRSELLDPLIFWCMENCEEQWHIFNYSRIYFNSQKDYAAFLLQWQTEYEK